MSRLVLRRATLADAGLLLRWANDRATREASFGRASISRVEHLHWLAAVVDDRDRRLWIGEETGIPVGQVRLDREPDGSGTVSIGLDPTARGRGLGELLLLAAIRAGVRELGIEPIRAHVLSSNQPSRRLFERCGFRVVGSSERAGSPAALLYELTVDA